MPDTPEKQSWLNRTVLGVGLTSLFSDWSHETATAVLPAFLAAIGAGPVWLGAIEGIADGLSSFTKLAAGHYNRSLKTQKASRRIWLRLHRACHGVFSPSRRTPIMYSLAASPPGWAAVSARPAKKALLAADVPPNAYGRAFGFERLMDTVGAIAGPLTALLAARSHRPFLPQSFFSGRFCPASWPSRLSGCSSASGPSPPARNDPLSSV